MDEICKFCKKDLDGWKTMGLNFHPQCFEFAIMNGLIKPDFFAKMLLKDYWKIFPNGWTDVKKEMSIKNGS